MEEELNELLSRLEILKENIKDDKKLAHEISEKTAPIDYKIIMLKKDNNDIKNKIDLKKNSFKYLKPLKKICLKHSFIYEILMLCIVVIVTIFVDKFLLLGLISTIPATGIMVFINYLLLSKDIRKEIRKINVRELENNINLNEEEILKYENERQNLKVEEKEVWEKVRNKASAIQNLENEIKYLNQAINWQKQREEKNNVEENQKQKLKNLK